MLPQQPLQSLCQLPLRLLLLLCRKPPPLGVRRRKFCANSPGPALHLPLPIKRICHQMHHQQLPQFPLQRPLQFLVLCYLSHRIPHQKTCFQRSWRVIRNGARPGFRPLATHLLPLLRLPQSLFPQIGMRCCPSRRMSPPLLLLLLTTPTTSLPSPPTLTPHRVSCLNPPLNRAESRYLLPTLFLLALSLVLHVGFSAPTCARSTKVWILSGRLRRRWVLCDVSTAKRTMALRQPCSAINDLSVEPLPLQPVVLPLLV